MVMKKKTIDILTTALAVILFLFALAAFWFDKMDGIMLVVASVVAIGLITFKNDKLESFIDKILNLKK